MHSNTEFGGAWPIFKGAGCFLEPTSPPVPKLPTRALRRSRASRLQGPLPPRGRLHDSAGGPSPSACTAVPTVTRPSRTRPSWPRTGWHTAAPAPTRAPTARRLSPTLPSWQPTASRTVAPAHTHARTAQRPSATAPSWQPTCGPTPLPAPTRAPTAPSPSATPPSSQPTATRTMPPNLAPIHARTAPRLFHSPPNWPPIVYVTTRRQRRAARPHPGIAAPAVARPLARDASCSFTNAATTRLRVRGSGSEPCPWLTGPLCRQPRSIK